MRLIELQQIAETMLVQMHHRLSPSGIEALQEYIRLRDDLMTIEGGDLRASRVFI